MATQIQLRRDTAANWSSSNSILAQGEVGHETDTGKFKIGDGSTAWNSLEYAALPPTGGTLTGDVTLDNQSDLRFGEATANGTNYVAFQAPASIAADVTWTLPAADGTVNQVLSTDGSGTLSFATPPSATGVSLGLVIALS